MALDVAPGLAAWVVARDAIRTLSPDRSTFFRGSAISRDRRQLAFGIDGISSAGLQNGEALTGADGEFVSVHVDDEQIRVVRDLFGHVRLLWTECEGIVAISDALLPLVEFRRRLGFPPVMNEQVLLARSVLNEVAGQQLSDQTIVDDISFVPAGKNLSISRGRDGGPPLVRVTGGPLLEGSVARVFPDDYRTAIRQAAIRVAELLGACATVDHWNLSLSLSGGYDSRVVFAAADLMGLQRRLRIDTVSKTAEHQRDFDVASSLSSSFGFAFNKDPARAFERSVEAPTPMDRLTLWGASLAGVYDGMGPALPYRAHANKFEFSGLGAELLKGNWGWKSWSRLLADTQLEDGDARVALDLQGRRGLRLIGADPDAPTASEYWYASYRNGVHGAAGHVSLHLTGLLAAQQWDLMRLAHALRASSGRPHRRALSHLGHEVVADQTAVADLSILLSPGVALHAYDESSRDLQPSYVKSRLEWLGGALSRAEVQPLAVHGHPSDDVGGTSSMVLEMSKARGFTEAGVSTEKVFSKARERIESLPPGALREAYRGVQDNAEWRVFQKRRPVWFAGASVAKVLSLALFDR